MNRQVWIHRAAAVGAVVLGVITIASTVSIAGDWNAVAHARSAPGESVVRRTSRAAAPAWRPAGPALRVARGDPKIAIGEYLNGQLGEVGLNIVSVDVPSVRGLGSGLKLAEVRIEARGDAKAVAGAVNWVATNHDIVRLRSVSMGVGPTGDGVATLVLLMVIA